MSEMSESINNLAAALAKAQGQFTNPERNREVEVRTKTGGSYKFRYATLDNILAMARKPLSENGLSVVQTVAGVNGALFLETTLMHASGQWIRTMLPISVEGGGNQALGGAITYAKRYAITAMLGIAADDDDDGNAAEGNTIVAHKDRAPARKDDRQQKPPAKQQGVALSTADGTVMIERASLWLEAFEAEIKAASANGRAAACWDHNREVFDNLHAKAKPEHIGVFESVRQLVDELLDQERDPFTDQQKAA